MEYSTYHPLFLYESLLDLITMVVLLWLGRRFINQLKNGDLFIDLSGYFPNLPVLSGIHTVGCATSGTLNINQVFME